MPLFSKFRVTSAFGAVVAATLVTLVSAVPEAVQARDFAANCGSPAPACIGPVRY